MTLAPDQVPLQSGLTGLAAEISARMLQGHLVNRAPEVVDPGSEYFPLLVDHLKGIAAEVTAIVGTAPTGQRRDLALSAIGIGVARNLEEAVFPEQQLGDNTRAEQLERRYLSLLKLLRETTGDPGEGSGAAAASAPLGTFPPAPPDPADCSIHPARYGDYL